MLIKWAQSFKSSLFISFMTRVCKWLLYLFKFLQPPVLGSTWKNELSSWEMRPRRLGFLFVKKMLRLLEFLCQCQFLVPWVKWVEPEGWEMGLKDLCNKSWEMPLRHDWGLQSLHGGRGFNFRKDLFLITFFIVIGKQWTFHGGGGGQGSQFKMAGSMSYEIGGISLGSSY